MFLLTKRIDMMFPASRTVAPWAVMLKYLWSGRYREIPAITGQRAQAIVKLLSRSRRIFGQLRVTCKVKRRLTLTFRNHKFKTTRKIQDDRLANIARNGVSVGRCSSWCCSWGVHEPNHQICGNDVCSWAWWPSISPMRTAHEHDVEKYVHDVIMNLEKSWWLPHPAKYITNHSWDKWILRITILQEKILCTDILGVCALYEQPRLTWLVGWCWINTNCLVREHT